MVSLQNSAHGQPWIFSVFLASCLAFRGGTPYFNKKCAFKFNVSQASKLIKKSSEQPLDVFRKST